MRQRAGASREGGSAGATQLSPIRRFVTANTSDRLARPAGTIAKRLATRGGLFDQDDECPSQEPLLQARSATGLPTLRHATGAVCLCCLQSSPFPAGTGCSKPQPGRQDHYDYDHCARVQWANSQMTRSGPTWGTRPQVLSAASRVHRGASRCGLAPVVSVLREESRALVSVVGPAESHVRGPVEPGPRRQQACPSMQCEQRRPSLRSQALQPETSKAAASWSGAARVRRPTGPRQPAVPAAPRPAAT